MLRARSMTEARLYIAHEPCPRCGVLGFAEPSRLADRDGRLVVACAGYCARCGEARRFELELAEARVPHDAWGGADASTLIDAGEWMAIADRHAEAVPAAPDLGAAPDPDARPHARAELALAIAALGEVLKFYAPGADDPPRSAFFTAAGRRTYMADPRRFARARVEIVLAAWQELAATLA